MLAIYILHQARYRGVGVMISIVKALSSQCYSLLIKPLLLFYSKMGGMRWERGSSYGCYQIDINPLHLFPCSGVQTEKAPLLQSKFVFCLLPTVTAARLSSLVFLSLYQTTTAGTQIFWWTAWSNHRFNSHPTWSFNIRWRHCITFCYLWCRYASCQDPSLVIRSFSLVGSGECVCLWKV